MRKDLQSAVSAYGVSVKAKLAGTAISGAPEDQLRNPLETLITELAELSGLAPSAVHLVGETTLAHLQSRPDFAVSVNNALMGFIEVKAPGKGFDPRKFTDPHDKGQWNKLKSLPNLIYTDGTGFSLWRDGEIAAKPVEFEGDLEKSGAKLTAPPQLLALISDFLTWTPQPPKNAKALANVAARLCRLLRGEVMEQMELGNESLLHLKDDWRKLLFPDADNERFADGYAQAVTFGLLMARAFNIPLDDGVEQAALKLKKTNSLIGTALNLLTENAENQQALKTSLDTLLRVLHEVDWAAISKDKPEAWLYFYEDFLEVYDNKLRKQTGSYYTPPEVVSAMVRLVDEALRGPLFERAGGLASPDVTIADPAVGTGTFLLGVLRKIAANVEESEGEGTVAGAITSAAKRLYGFEMQFGPFAVAQLRLLAEMRALLRPNSSKLLPEVNLFITNTLGNPFEEEEKLPHILEAVAKSRRDANKVKRGQPITVVIGNPPYKDKADGKGGWIEAGTGGRHEAPLDRWKAPVEWGVGAHGKHLKNLYIYFWRWATLKVFGAGLNAATDLPDSDEEGLICYITVSGFLNGPGFQKMRDDMRRTCSAIWVIDCSPEGHQPEVANRIFQGVQQPICIVLAARRLGNLGSTPAKVKFLALPPNDRKAKFAALQKLTLYAGNWQECSSEWRAPFLPSAAGLWNDFVCLKNIFTFAGPGMILGRTWVFSPDRTSLQDRWSALKTAKGDHQAELYFPQLRNGLPASRHIDKVVKQDLGNLKTRRVSIRDDQQPCPEPLKFAFRSFDRQWFIADVRMINDHRPKLWDSHSSKQVYLNCLDAISPDSGPAISFAEDVPDLNYYHGRSGRVYPLWSDAKATQSNIRSEVLALLAQAYGHAVSPEDVMAYIAAVMAHPAFTARFKKDLVRPGLRLPLTADAALFAEAVKLGREVIWLHSYGERFTDAKAGRPKGAPRMAKDIEPTITAKGQIPPAPEPLPDTIHHNPATNRLHVGKGYVENVTTAMWEYEVSGKQVVKQWFSYRKFDRSRPIIGDRRPPSPLEKIQPEGWLSEYTTDLLNLLRVLGRLVALEPQQADLLARICEAPLVPVDELRKAGLIGADENEESRVDASEPETV